MRVVEQTSLRATGSVEGVGLHSGAATRLALRPAAADVGIVFRRMDLRRTDGPRVKNEPTTIKAAAHLVVETRRGVTLENEHGASVMTVEHILAALAIAGVDNAIIDVFGPEIPILDGSAAPFLDLINRCGVARLATPREIIVVAAPMREESGDSFVEVAPFDGRLIEVTIDFPDTAIGRQSIAVALDDASPAAARVAAARTFCSLKDVNAMRAAGLGKGGSLENSIVVDGERLLNEGGLRDPSEFALHKALDLIGDLSLAGAPVYGRVRAFKPGHDLNTRLARRLAAADLRRPLREAARLTA